jgi:hypothetical protein
MVGLTNWTIREMRSNRRLNEFWNWFAANAESISSNARPDLLEKLNEKLRQVDQRLSWEIGPGRHEPWLLAISPNLDKSLVDDARKVITEAPEIPGWELYATRQPKQWDFRVEIDCGSSHEKVYLDASDWQFVLLRYPDGLREILLTGPNLPVLTDDQRWQAAAIVLEGVLGEESLLENVDEFELVVKMEPRFKNNKRPISELKAAMR